MDGWFPKQLVQNAMGIIYPQYWPQINVEVTNFPRHLTCQKASSMSHIHVDNPKMTSILLWFLQFYQGGSWMFNMVYSNWWWVESTIKYTKNIVKKRWSKDGSIFTMMLGSEHVSMSLWTWTYEHEHIYLEHFNDGDKIFLEYPYVT